MADKKLTGDVYYPSDEIISSANAKSVSSFINLQKKIIWVSGQMKLKT